MTGLVKKTKPCERCGNPFDYFHERARFCKSCRIKFSRERDGKNKNFARERRMEEREARDVRARSMPEGEFVVAEYGNESGGLTQWRGARWAWQFMGRR